MGESNDELPSLVLPALPGLSINPSRSFTIGFATSLESLDSPRMSDLGNDSETLPGRGTRRGPRADGEDFETFQPLVSGPAADKIFTMRKLVGRGGSGEVWEGLQNKLKRVVALKRIRPDVLSSGDNYLKQELHQSFQDEALTAASLDHPNIVPVYDFGVLPDGDNVIAMKYVRGTSWEQLLEEDGRSLSAEDYYKKHLDILEDICQATNFAHAQGILHRDLKPAQVMIGGYGEVLLMDWGLAVRMREVDPELLPGLSELPIIPTAANPAGTPAYMAPEQTEYTSANLSEQTDVYLLGGILYRILTGYPPHQSSSSLASFRQAAAGEFLPIGEMGPGDRPIPADLADVAIRAMTHDRKGRQANVKAFLTELRDVRSGASRRREASAQMAQLSDEIATKPPATYADFARMIDLVRHARTLWPDHPQSGRLRAKLTEGYAELAIKLGDLGLALANAEFLEDGPIKRSLKARIDAENQRRRRQRRITIVSLFGTFLLLLAIIAGGAVFSLQLSQAKEAEEAERVRAEIAELNAQDERNRAVDQANAMSMLLASSLLETGRIAKARETIWTVPEEARNWEWGLLLNRAYRSLAEFNFQAIRFRRFRSQCLTESDMGTGNGRLELRSLDTGLPLMTYDCGGLGLLTFAGFDGDDGQYVVAINSGRYLSVWNTDTGQQIYSYEDLEGRLLWATYKEADRRIFVRYNDYHDASWKTDEDGPATRVAYGALRASDVLAPTDDGKYFINSYNAVLYAFHAENGDPLGHSFTFPSHILIQLNFFEDNRNFLSLLSKPGWLWSGRLNDDGISVSNIGVAASGYCTDVAGQRAIAWHQDGSLVEIDLNTMLVISRAQAPKAPDAGTYSADGRHVALASGADLMLIDLTRGFGISGVHRGHTSAITEFGYIEGGRVATTSTDGTTCIWDAAKSASFADFQARHISMSHDGKYAVGIRDYNSPAYSFLTGEELGSSGDQFNIVRGVSIIPQTDELVVIGKRNLGPDEPADAVNLMGYSLDSLFSSRKRHGTIFHRFRGYEEIPTLDRSTRQFVGIPFGNGSVDFIDIDTGEVVKSIEPIDEPLRLASPTGREGEIIVAGARGTIAVVQPHDESSPVVSWQPHEAAARLVSLSPDGKLLVSSTLQDTRLVFSDPLGGRIVAERSLEEPEAQVTFLCTWEQSGDRLATAATTTGGQFICTIWSRRDLRPLASFPMGINQPSRGGFIKDEDRVWWDCGPNEKLRVWNASTGKEITGIDEDIAALSSDGRRILRKRGDRFSSDEMMPWQRNPALPGSFFEQFPKIRRDRYRAWRQAFLRRGSHAIQVTYNRAKLGGAETHIESCILEVHGLLEGIDYSTPSETLRVGPVLEIFGKALATLPNVQPTNGTQAYTIKHLSRIGKAQLARLSPEAKAAYGYLAAIHTDRILGLNSTEMYYVPANEMAWVLQVLDYMGDEELGRPIAERLVAYNKLRGIESANARLRWVNLKGAEPPDPPADLILVPGSNVCPRATNEGLPNVIEQEAATRRYHCEWIKTALPAFDFAALAKSRRAALPQFEKIPTVEEFEAMISEATGKATHPGGTEPIADPQFEENLAESQGI